MNNETIGNVATDMDRACGGDVDDLLEEEHRPRYDGCGGVLEPWDDESPVIYDCFHALHAGCADGRDACPRCHTPRRVHDDDDQPEQVDEAAAAPASPPDNNNNLDEDSALVSDGMGNDDDWPARGETGEARPSRCDDDGDFKPGDDGESPASMSVSGCNHACYRRVTELEGRLQEKSAALAETTTVLELESELERAQSRLCRLEEMYGKLEDEFIGLRNDKRVREIEDAEEEEAAERRKERSKAHTRPY